jgi:hypothetical protein
MKTTRVLFFPGFLLVSALCYGADFSPVPQTFVATDAMISRGQFEQNPFSSQTIRLSFDLPRSVPLASSGEVPIQPDADSLSSVPVRERVGRGTESAEKVNVEAMRDYRERWDKFREQFSQRPKPILYPSTIQRTLEDTK